jgi:FHA domain
VRRIYRHCVQDFSTNGTKLNDHIIKKSSVILMHGDVLKIPSSQSTDSYLLSLTATDTGKPGFRCIYTNPTMGPQKKTLFDPTPPLAPVDKASACCIWCSRGFHVCSIDRWKLQSNVMHVGKVAPFDRFGRVHMMHIHPQWHICYRQSGIHYF